MKCLRSKRGCRTPPSPAEHRASGAARGPHARARDASRRAHVRDPVRRLVANLLCEPGIVDGPGNAGLARMHVIATDQTGNQHRLVFEVWVKKLTWWGDAAGETFGC